MEADRQVIENVFADLRQMGVDIPEDISMKDLSRTVQGSSLRHTPTTSRTNIPTHAQTSSNYTSPSHKKTSGRRQTFLPTPVTMAGDGGDDDSDHSNVPSSSSSSEDYYSDLDDTLVIT